MLLHMICMSLLHISFFFILRVSICPFVFIRPQLIYIKLYFLRESEEAGINISYDYFFFQKKNVKTIPHINTFEFLCLFVLFTLKFITMCFWFHSFKINVCESMPLPLPPPPTTKLIACVVVEIL